MNQTHYAIIFILRPAGDSYEFLLARRAEGRYMGGTWQLISGKIESGETAWEAAIREMREETSLRPMELYRLSHLTQFYRPDNDSLNTGVTFCAIVPANASVSLDNENTEFQWMPLDDTRDQLMWKNDQEAFDEVCRVILDDGPSKPYQQIPL